MTRTVSSSSEVFALVGQEIGASNWLLVDQKRIDTFADATGDLQWIHVDTARAACEAPGGTTIAHGYLMLALVPMLRGQILDFANLRMGINYGLDRVRFINPVPVGARVRVRQSLKSADLVKQNGLKMLNEITMEISGETLPAVIAETISIIYFDQMP